MSTAPIDSSAPMDESSAASTSVTSTDPPVHKKKRKRDRHASGEIDILSESSSSIINHASAAVGVASVSSAPSVSVAPIKPEVLIGKAGADAIRHGIVQTKPALYIAQFQKDHGIKVPGLDASLSFLDLFIPKRGPLYASLLNDMSQQLTTKISSGQIPPERMQTLLEASFPYIRVEELAQIPITLLQTLTNTNSLPSKYLKALSTSPESFLETLPMNVRRKLMEYDPQTLFWQTEAMKRVLRQYAEHEERINDYARLLPVDHVTHALKKVRTTLPSSSSGSALSSSAGSTSAIALNTILDWLGSNSRLYRFLCTRLRELCTTCEIATQENPQPIASFVWRSLRVDLLMRIHETATAAVSTASFSTSSTDSSSSTATLSAATVDPLHKWVWCLDTAARHDQFDTKLLDTLLGSIDTEGEGGDAGFLPGLHVKHHTLHDLALLTGHPYTLSALLRAIVNSLIQVVEHEQTPSDHPQLASLTKMLHLALCDSTTLAQISAEAFEAGHSGLNLPDFVGMNELFDEFYPLIVELIIYAQLGEMEPLSEKLVEFVNTVPLARYVYLYYLLTRIQAADVTQVSALLVTLPKWTEKGVNVWTSASRTSEQQLLFALLRTLLALLSTSMSSILQTDATFRTTIISNSLLALASLSPYAHRYVATFLLECEDIIPRGELVQFLKQVELHGSTEMPPPPVSSSDAMSDVTPMPATPLPSTYLLLPTNNIQTQLSRWYEQAKQTKPHLFTT